jgi:RNA polymerase sigma factor (sigma-70 family)
MISHYELLERCKKGERKAQRILYDLFKARLMGLCRRYTQSREEAQDVLQESFIKIFSKIDQLESAEKIEGWVKSITVRSAIDHYHRNKNSEELFARIEFSELENQSAKIALNDITDEYLVSIIGNLPNGCRMIFNLFAVEGYSHAEIATLLNISEGTSRSQMHYAKYLLREKLKGRAVQYYEKLS